VSKIYRKVKQNLSGPLAYSFELATCNDPDCGAHLLALDEDGECIAEIVIKTDDIAEVADRLHDVAYAKIVERDDG
jgi:hypothetical protein